MSDKIAVILSKARDPQPEMEGLERKILAGLSEWPGAEVTVVPHLYDLDGDGLSMRALREVERPMIVLAWLYPRATFWVLGANGIRGRLEPTFSLPEEDVDEPPAEPDGPERSIWCFDLRSDERAETFLAGMAEILEPEGETAAAPSGERIRTLNGPTRPRWYPVVDYTRCTHCLECLNFCLFGVFGLDETDSLLIEQPDACRAGCPACSRICPQGAIMFPQHNDPAIAGDAKASLGGLKLDLSQLFSGAGFPPASAAELAESERRRALVEQQAAQREALDAEPAEPDDLDHLVDEVDNLDL